MKPTVNLTQPLANQLTRHAATIGDKTAFTDGYRTVTYHQLERRTARLAGNLTDAGARDGCEP